MLHDPILQFLRSRVSVAQLSKVVVSVVRFSRFIAKPAHKFSDVHEMHSGYFAPENSFFHVTKVKNNPYDLMDTSA